MAPNGSACLRKSSTALNARNVLKKGPWTVSEDTILVEYVKKHGEGNWNAVQRNSGLMRCGKSCRLRWANHLRPNLKKGAFSAEEERLIVELHAKLGNKWARMAAQLPGRTDNEIKNYWNTRFKRRQRAGLPIYPQELCQENQQLNSSLSSLLALSSNPTNLTSSLCFLDNLKSTSTINHPLQNNPNTSSYTNQELKLFQDNNGGLALSLAASNSSFSASSTMATQPFFNQTLPSVPIPSLLQYNSLNLGFNSCNEMGILELPSIQPSIAATPTPSSSEDYEVEMGFSRGKKSGLLEDLLGESQALNCSEKTEEDSLIIEGIDEGKSTWDFSMIECGEAASNLNERSDVNFVHGSVTATSENNYEGTEKKAEVDGMNCVDDDILNLLDNFPLSVPIPDWNESNPCDCESSNLTNGTNGDTENQPKASTYNPVAYSTEAADQERNFGQCFWNNMPSIY